MALDSIEVQAPEVDAGRGRPNRGQQFLIGLRNVVSAAIGIPTGQTAPVTPGVRGSRYASIGTTDSFHRLEDDEYRILPVRSPSLARVLLPLRDFPEADTCVKELLSSMFASENGDDAGFRIAELTVDLEPCDPDVLRIGNEAIKRLFTFSTCWSIAQGFLYDGDSFRSLVIADDLSHIVRLKQLPTWQMFREEDIHGEVLQFNQRSSPPPTKPDYEINPRICVHWRLSPQGKYGKALFHAPAIRGDFIELEKAISALRQGARDVGYNPRVHRLPSDWDITRCEAYRKGHEAAKLDPTRIVTDFYVQEPGTVTTVSSSSGSMMRDLSSTVESMRARIAMSAQVPPWILGLSSQSGATDVGGQPSLSYARVISTLRAVFSEGARQVIEVELACHGIEPDRWDFTFQYPKLFTSILAQSTADPDDIGSSGLVGPASSIKPSGSEQNGQNRGGSVYGSNKRRTGGRTKAKVEETES